MTWSSGAGDRAWEAMAHDLLGQVDLEEGRLDEAEERLARAMRLFSEVEDRGGETTVHWHLSMLALRRGDLEACEHDVLQLRVAAEEMADPWEMGNWRLARAFLDHARGDRDGLARDLPPALRRLGAVVDRWRLANAVRLAGVTAVQQGAKEAALVLFSAAEGMDEAIGACPGATMRKLAADGAERALCGTQPASALAAAARGRRMTLGEVVDFAVGIVESGTGGVAAVGGLTRREGEVARLMARGATDREIGTRLGISTRTAEKHAENVRSKLGVETRAAVGEALTT